MKCLMGKAADNSGNHELFYTFVVPLLVYLNLVSTFPISSTIIKVVQAAVPPNNVPQADMSTIRVGMSMCLAKRFIHFPDHVVSPILVMWLKGKM